MPTPPGSKSPYPSIVLPLILLLATLVGLHSYGTGTRVIGATRAVGAGAMPVTVAATPQEAYQSWRRLGVHGRVLVSVSRRMHFVSPAGNLAPVSGRYPVPKVSLADRMREQVGEKDLLLAAVEGGIAREVRHILPEAVFAEKAAAVRGETGVEVTGDTIATDYHGTPRTVTTFSSFHPPAEPVLLHVDASVFSHYEPQRLLELLRGARLQTDCLLLTAFAGSEGVGERERERLARFAELVRHGHE